jgi:hypothetical protein
MGGAQTCPAIGFDPKLKYFADTSDFGFCPPLSTFLAQISLSRGLLRARRIASERLNRKLKNAIGQNAIQLV